MATDTKEAPKAKEAAAPVSIRASDVQLAEVVRNVYEVVAPPGATVDDLTRPMFWSPIARQLLPKDLAYVQAVDGAWLAVCRVRSVFAGGAQVVVLQTVKLPAILGAIDGNAVPGYRIWLDEINGWSVQRLSDNLLMRNQKNDPAINSYEAARRYIYDHATERQRV